jgi:glycerol-3-phosphate dehydrogenase
MAGIDEVTLSPRRGEYIVFDDMVGPHPQTILHCLPTPTSKGIYAVTTVEGNLMLGPTNEDLPPDEKDNLATTVEGQQSLWQQAALLLQLPPSRSTVIKTFAGLRPEPIGGQYIIRWYDIPWGFINVAGIRSPGLTAAPAIARYVAQEIIDPVFNMRKKSPDNWHGTRQRRQPFINMTPSQQARAIADHPSSGRVVCRCKGVTEREVVDAIHHLQQLGVDTVTLDTIKFRTLAMFGHCQGTFCRTHISRIIARELGLPLWKVMLSDSATSYALGDIKVLQSCQEADS